MSNIRAAAQRRSERKPAEIVVTLVIEGDEADHLANAVDPSQHGLRLQTDVPLAPGQHVDLVLFKGPTLTLPSRVVRVRAMEPSGELHARLEFVTPLPADA